MKVISRTSLFKPSFDPEIKTIDAAPDQAKTQSTVVTAFSLFRQSAKRKSRTKMLSMLLLLLGTGTTIRSQAQSTYKEHVAVGRILASMPAGLTLLDGTVLKAEIVLLGDIASPRLSAATAYPDHGFYYQYQYGGVFNGVNDGKSGPIGPDGATLGGYNGSKQPILFTRINANPRGYIDNGIATDYATVIGFHVWADRPFLAKQLLMVDCDGTVKEANREWLSIFGYNGVTPVNPSISLSSTSELESTLSTVHSTWQALVEAKIGSKVPLFTQRDIVSNKTEDPTIGNDPDNLDRQALFDFGTSKVNRLFIFWGIKDNLPPTGRLGSQTSGISPLLFEYNFDWGDAPDSFYKTSAQVGPSHAVPEIGRLMLGTNVSFENEGVGNELANTDADDGISLPIDSIYRSAKSSAMVGSYTLKVKYTNNSGQTAYYAAWIDWNNNETFDAGEGITNSSLATSTTGTISFTWTNEALNKYRPTNYTYARIRTSTQKIGTDDALGRLLQNGEVEDYWIPLARKSKAPLAPAMSIASYQANPELDKVQLQWSVSDQINVARYEIHRSGNGIDFDNIGFLDADKEQSQYTLWDEHPLEGTNLYQLKAVSLDGEYQPSPNTLKVHFGENSSKTIFYPNPAGHTLSINTSGYSDLLELKVYTLIGQQVMQQSLSKGLNTIDINSLSNGAYYFKLMNDTQQVASEKIQIAK